MKSNYIICGDNLEILKTIESESVDLCYIDPPFFTQRDFGEFSDQFESLEYYLEYIKLRVIEIHRILKNTGSFYLHCDKNANAYLKVMCDLIFGFKNFLNEIIWDYGKYPNMAKTKFLRSHDTILFYSKSNEYTFNLQYFDESSARRKKIIKTGYNTKTLDGKKYLYYYGNNAKGKIDESRFDVIKDIDISRGSKIPDIWRINILNSQSKENLKYPTQKPEELLECIIKTSSNEGDIVLDCFCGSGTTIAVSKQLNRQYIGIDKNLNAIKLTNERLTKEIQILKQKKKQRCLW